MRERLSDAPTHRSVAQTCTPNSRARKIELAAWPQPRSSTRVPGFRSIADASHSVSQSTFDPMALAITQSGWYRDERGKRSERSRASAVMSACVKVRMR